MGIGVIDEVDAKVARATRTAELVQRFLVNLERGQVFEQRAIPPAVDGCVDPFGSQAVISGGTRGVLTHRPTCCLITTQPTCGPDSSARKVAISVTAAPT